MLPTNSTKLFQPRKHKRNDKNIITFTKSYDPNPQFLLSQFKNCIKHTANRKLQKVCNVTKIFLTIQEPKKLRNMLVRAKFETKTKVIIALAGYAQNIFRDCNKAELYFHIFPFYYEKNTALREYKENDIFSDGNLH